MQTERATNSLAKSAAPNHSTGETVQILYPLRHPGWAIIDGFMDRYFLPMMLGGLGTIFALVGGGILFAYFRRKKIIASLRQNGLPIQAKFLETYRLLCEATHLAKYDDFGWNFLELLRRKHSLFL
jgi:hypothetical protein